MINLLRLTRFLSVAVLVFAAAVFATGAVAASHGGAVVKLGHSGLGRIIVDSQGKTVYLWAHDKRGKSTCYGKCAKAWPALITRGKPRAISGARSALLGTTRRTDGRMQVTYRRHPLYYFAGDKRAGQTAGEGLAAFGGRWDAVSAAGTAVKKPAMNPYYARDFRHPTLRYGVLTVEGTNQGDRIALRLQAGQPGIIQVDAGDDGSADFSFNRADVSRIVVDGGNGGDSLRIDESNGAFADTIPTTLDGGNGNDRLAAGSGVETVLGGNGNDSLFGGAGASTLDGGNGNDSLSGGSGAERLFGGNGNDSIDGHRGNDAAFMGNGDDSFVWDPGEGSDTIEGDNGNDTMVFDGAPAAEKVDLTANGNHLKFFRDVANITMDTHGVERVDFNALGGIDVVTVNDLSGTDVKEVNVDLAGTLGGATGDGAADSVLVNGTDGDDTINVAGNAAGVKVSGLVPTVNVFHSEAADDQLKIDDLAGTDSVNSAGLAAGVIQLFVDGVLVP